jgi:diguanylate cyclase (GGDEF)-like protein
MTEGVSSDPSSRRRPRARSSDRAPRRIDSAHRFAFAVMLAGIGLVAAIAATGGFATLAHPSLAYIIYALLTIGGELFMLRLPSRSNEVLLSASSIFAYATALRFGPGLAMVALGIGALAKGVVDRRPPIKTAFNTAQHTMTVGLAGLVYHHLGGHASVIGSQDLPPALLGALAYLVINYTLTGTVVALATGTRVSSQLFRGFGVWLPVEGVMLCFAPVVPIVAGRSLWMFPLLLVPFLGVYYSAQIALRAEFASMHDALTGLPNRVLFRMRVEQALLRTRHTRERVLVLVLDLDSFKEVNDTLGHGRGDELLCAIAERLRRALREADVVAHLGGDEFGVVVSNLKPNLLTPELLADRIREALDTPFQLADLWVNAQSSIGIAVAPDHGSDAEKLIQCADVAMYQAKTTGTGYARYDAERDPHRPDNLRLVQELREGIGRGELILHYQPKVQISDGEVVGVEALARWKHPTRGLLMPIDFIELAERTELVRSLTLSVVRQAARQTMEWMRAGICVPVAVNLSPRILLDVALATDIAVVLEEEGLPTEMLEVEVTESCLVADPDRTAEVLGRLNETGVQISIDDFGTGYSSLALLKRLPVDTIKIDQSFVANLASDANDMVIVESTVKLALGLGLEVIAEGVESAEAWRLLSRCGCRQAQGFHICRPLPPDELVSWLLHQPPAEQYALAGSA